MAKNEMERECYESEPKTRKKENNNVYLRCVLIEDRITIPYD